MPEWRIPRRDCRVRFDRLASSQAGRRQARGARRIRCRDLMAAPPADTHRRLPTTSTSTLAVPSPEHDSGRWILIRLWNGAVLACFDNEASARSVMAGLADHEVVVLHFESLRSNR